VYVNLEKLTFVGASGASLSAVMAAPADRDPWAYALMAHCFACSKNYHAVSNVSRVLVQYGLGVLRFDFTGLGESEGSFETTNFSSTVEDLLVAAEFLRGNYAAPSLLVGHSLGGAAVLQAAGLLDSVRAVATIAAPSEPSYVARLLVGDRGEEAVGVELTVGGQTFRITRQLLEDLDSQNMRERIGELQVPILVVHSAADRTVGIDNGLQIFDWANYPKGFIGLDTADHLLSNRRDSSYVGEMIAQWVTRYLPG
jgi:alpha-beta hydrolase superfamily lysophospholipase